MTNEDCIAPRQAKIHFTIIYLQEVANELEVLRIGPQHQAGSDSLLTGQTFFKMKEMFFEDDIDDSKYCGHLYGKNVVLTFDYQD